MGTWADVGFHQLRAMGALLVSANRTAGSTRFVRLLSEHERDVTLHVHDKAWETATLPFTAPSSVKVRAAGADGRWTLSLAHGQSVVLWMGSVMPQLVVAPVVGTVKEYNYWG